MGTVSEASGYVTMKYVPVGMRSLGLTAIAF